MRVLNKCQDAGRQMWKSTRVKLAGKHTIGVRRKEGKLAGQITCVGHLVLLISHGEEQRGGKLTALLARFRQSKAQDAVNTVEVRTVAIRDDPKRCRALVIAELRTGPQRKCR